MKCLETRQQKDGTRRRRYRTDDGRTLVTVEVPLTVFRGAVNPVKLGERMAAWRRAEDRRARRKRALDMIAEGIKPLAIGDEVGLTARHVQRLRKRAAKA